MNLELKPAWPLVLLAARGVREFAKLLCVAVWFIAANWNVSVSPTCVLMLLGKNMSSPLLQTVMKWFCEAVFDKQRRASSQHYQFKVIQHDISRDPQLKDT